MIKLILTDSSSNGVLLETETLKVTNLDYTYNIVERAYVAPCDLEVIFNGNTYTALKGAIILKLYPIGDGNKELIIFNNNEYLSYIDRYKEYVDSRNNSKSKDGAPIPCCKN